VHFPFHQLVIQLLLNLPQLYIPTQYHKIRTGLSGVASNCNRLELLAWRRKWIGVVLWVATRILMC